MIDPVHWIAKTLPGVLNDYSGFYFIFKSLSCRLIYSDIAIISSCYTLWNLGFYTVIFKLFPFKNQYMLSLACCSVDWSTVLYMERLWV